MTKDKALKQAYEAILAYLSATNSDEDQEAHELMASAFFAIKDMMEKEDD
jgi:hypothetical protein